MHTPEGGARAPRAATLTRPRNGGRHRWEPVETDGGRPVWRCLSCGAEKTRLAHTGLAYRRQGWPSYGPIAGLCRGEDGGA